MAARTALLLLASLLLRSSSALQVTPNSPCASFCLDSNDLDYSDPNSSNTKPKDITCGDGTYVSEQAGQKFQRCMACLQESEFVQNSENDQQWFLFNLRYSFDYCVFGFPNGSDVGSNPCQTSTACGALEAALKDGDLDPLKSTQYSYCDADGSAVTGGFFDKCLQCVRAWSDHHYLSNFLVALNAGCKQRPQPGQVVGLNDTVFTTAVVQMIEPTPTGDPEDKGSKLPTTTIVVIAIGGLVASLLAAGCAYIQYRKHKVRKYGRNAARGRRNVSSSLSFQCQTNLPPMTPEFCNSTDEFSSIDEEKPYTSPSEALSSNPVATPASNHSPTSGKPNLWNPHNAIKSLPASIERSPSKKLTKAPSKEALALRSITTTLPPRPPTAHQSPSTRSVVSPQDDFSTPTSAQSTAPLLPIKPYVPSEYGSGSPALGPAGFSPVQGHKFSSPTSAGSGSPLSQTAWPLAGSMVRSSPPTEHHRTFTPSRPVPVPRPGGVERGQFSGIPPGPPRR